jgi:D-sedoheptulose 7-phosphate isomerase
MLLPVSELTMGYFARLATAIQALDPLTLGSLLSVVRRIRMTQATLFVCGNGGSYATAQHWCADLHKAVGVQTHHLGGNAALLTAIGNDVQYSRVFADELLRYGYPTRDALVVLSVSGTSPNILAACTAAHDQHLPVVAITGTASTVIETHATIVIRVPDTDYGVVEDAMGAIGHWLIDNLRDR